MKRILILATLGMTACDLPSGAAVSDFNGNSVKVVAYMASIHSDSDAQAEATRICAKGGKKNAEKVSARNLPDYKVEYLFICS